jgi:toxin ParE2
VTIRFLEIAEIELDQAIHWYGAHAPGLGDAFLIDVLSTADRISRFPNAWHPPGEGLPLSPQPVPVRTDLHH